VFWHRPIIACTARHSTGVSGRHPAADIRGRRPSPSTLCRHYDAAGAADSAANQPSATKRFRWLRRERGTVCRHTSTSGPSHHCCHFAGRRKLISFVYYYYKSTDYSDASQSCRGTLHIRFKKKTMAVVCEASL